MAAGYVAKKIAAKRDASYRALFRAAAERIVIEAPPPRITVSLAPYQRAFCADPARFRSVVKARRCGGSFAAAYSAALRLAGLRMTPTGTIERDPGGCVPQRFVSHSEDGAVRLLAESHQILETFAADGLLPEGVKVGDLAATSFTLSNGVDATAHAGDGRTVRGVAGDITLDEFAYARDPKKLWAAVKSASDATLGRPQGYRVTVVTTPWLADSLPYFVCVAADTADDDHFKHFSRYSWPLSHVVTQGFPREMTPLEQAEYVQQTRAEIGDDSAFETEYEGAWFSGAEMFLERELLERARYDAADLPSTGDEFAGVDVARKGKHLTAIARLRVVQEPDSHGVPRMVMYALPVETLRGVDFATQEVAFARVIQGGMRDTPDGPERDPGGVKKLAIDATGIGLAPSEQLSKRFPGKVEQVTFTQATKESLASNLRLALEEGRLFLPHSPELLRDLASLRRIAQSGGGFRYDASDKGGSHADRAWALALAVHAAMTGYAVVGILSAPRRTVDAYGQPTASPRMTGGRKWTRDLPGG